MNEADSHPRTTYAERLDIRRAERAGSERWRGFHSYLQVATMAGAVVVVVPALNHVFSIAWEGVPAVVFLALFVSRDRLRRPSEMHLRAVRYFERGLARLDGNWAGAGESGIGYLDAGHPYAQDLDLFGKGSLFELLCNARTPMGQDTLAQWLLEPAQPDKIRERQEAVTELADRVDLREDIAVVAENARGGVHTEALYAWGERDPLLVPSPFRIVAWGLSVLGATAVVAFGAYLLAQFGILQLPEKTLAELELYFISMALIYSVVLVRFKRRTDRIIHEIEKAGSDLSLIAEVLLRLEAEQFASPRLAALRGELDAEGQPPSRRISRLNRLMELVDSRRNGVVRFIG